MDTLFALKETMENISKDSCKFFDKGNKAAGTRARKQLQELKKLAQDLRIGIQETKARMNQQIAVPHTYEHEEYTGQDAYKQEEDSSGFKMESPSGANAFGGPGKIEHATTSMPMTLGGGVTPVSGMQGGQNGMQSMGGMGGVSGQMVGVSGQMIGVNTSGGAPSHGQFEIKQQ